MHKAAEDRIAHIRRQPQSKLGRVLIAVLAASFALGLTSCGSGGRGQRPIPDFSVTSSPATLALTGGAAGVATSVSVVGANGFASTVSIGVSGLPPGVTVSPVTFSLAPGASQPVVLTASASAAAASGAITFTGTSGTLTHTFIVQLTVAAAPAPDFNLSLAPATLTLSAAGVSQQTMVSVAAVNGFTGSVAVSLSGLPAGVTASPATFTLAPGAQQALVLTAAASAISGTSTVTITGVSGALQHTATLALTVTAASTGVDATTYHFDNARTGLNPNETILNLANVNSTTFGKLNFLPTDSKVDAEPLYLSGVTIGGASHNVVYVASEHDTVYAFDADQGTQLWTVSTLGSAETTSDAHNCGQIAPEIGITSTPVIDRKLGSHGVLFVVAMSKDSGGAYHQRLHALDVATGAEVAGSPTEITATYPGNSAEGNVVFAPGQYAERVGLLMLNGTVYMGWTSHCDQRPYTGWVMGYSEATLQQTNVLNLTPNGSEGSVWMSGAGMAADASGNIYLLDANGTLDTALDANGFPAKGDYGNAILKLFTANGGLAVADYFEAYNTVAESNADVDLGSGGALLLPDQTDAGGGIHLLMVGAGKDKNIYVADRDSLGKFNATDNSRLYQEISNALPNGAWSMPAYFNNTVYYGGVNDVLRAFPVTNAKLNPTPASVSAAKFSYPGATPSISSNGVTNGIVWALESGTGEPAVLHAYDTTNLGNELYNSKQAADSRDSFGNGNKFITPMIVDGKVYVATPSGVAVFGLLPH